MRDFKSRYRFRPIEGDRGIFLRNKMRIKSKEFRNLLLFDLYQFFKINKTSMNEAADFFAFSSYLYDQ